jgi:MFS family permease
MAGSYLSKLRLFNRDVRLYLVAAGLAGFTVFGGIYPVLFNLYLLRLGYGPEFIGLVNAVYMLVAGIFSLPAGALGGRFGVRRVMISGLCLIALGSGTLPLVEFIPTALQPGWIVTTYLTAALGIILYIVNGSPFLSANTNQEDRSYAFSVQTAIWPLAGFAGSLVAGLMPGFFVKLLTLPVDDPATYRYPLLISGILMIPAVLIMLPTRDVSDVQKDETVAKATPPPYGLITILALVVLLQVAAEGAPRTFFNVYLDADLKVPTGQIGVLAAMAQLLAVPAALVTPLLMTRWGKERTVVISSLGMALSCLPLALIPHWSGAGFGYMLLMALASIARVVITVYHQELVAPVWRGAISGATTMAAALSWAGMAYGGGYLIIALSYSSLFLTGAGLTIAGTLLFWAYFRVPRGEFARSSAPVTAD